MAPWRASTTKSEWLPDNPTAFVPSRLWKLPFITTWDDSRNQNQPTDSAEQAVLQVPGRRGGRDAAADHGAESSPRPVHFPRVDRPARGDSGAVGHAGPATDRTARWRVGGGLPRPCDLE